MNQLSENRAARCNNPPQPSLLSRFGNAEERVEKALAALSRGEGILLVDDEDRENEGDLIFSAQHLNVTQMALLIRQCSGIVCLCLTQQRAAALDLPPMTRSNTSRFGTAFTVSIEAASGVTTGVSAADRVRTIQVAIDPQSQPADLHRPGHVFPLVAAPGGVSARRGHTEGSIELMQMAGLNPTAVLCELTNADGTMAKLPEVVEFGMENQLNVLSIEDIVAYQVARDQQPT